MKLHIKNMLKVYSIYLMHLNQFSFKQLNKNSDFLNNRKLIYMVSLTPFPKMPDFSKLKYILAR